MHAERKRRNGDPLKIVPMGRRPVPMGDRFWGKVDRRGPDDCWPWTGQIVKQGYAQFWTPEKTWRAHRLAYELLVGPIPEGMTLDHVCHTRSDCIGGPTCPHRRCVNPAHLEPVTDRENLLRGQSPFVVNSRKTHCIRDHEFTPENTIVASGTRHCRTCQAERKSVHC